MTTAQLTLAAFVLRMVEADEAEARARDADWDADDAFEQHELHGRQPHHLTCGWRLGEGIRKDCECGYPARVLAECAAKRAIVEHFSGESEEFWGAIAAVPLRALAAIYADHEDFNEAWAL